MLKNNLVSQLGSEGIQDKIRMREMAKCMHPGICDQGVGLDGFCIEFIYVLTIILLSGNLKLTTFGFLGTLLSSILD